MSEIHSATRQALGAAAISLAVSVLVLGLKWLAYGLTGSVALFSDALESFVNLAAASAALIALYIARRPADHEHPYGHAKAEYFSAVFEGSLIIVAALAIIQAAWARLFAPIALESTGLGLIVSLLATLCNAVLAGYLIRRGKHLHSPALRADGLHILSDVITSGGVLLGIALAWLSGWWILDPALAILVAVNILWMGSRLLRESFGGLMDEGLSAGELEPLLALMREHMGAALQIHQIKSRRAGYLTFLEFHLVVPSQMTVKDAHAICDKLEKALAANLPAVEVTIHVEPEASSEHGDTVVWKASREG